MDQPVFYYDLGVPECYLTAEQVTTASGGVPEFEPVLAVDLGLGASELDRISIERRARELGIQPLRWPEPWPPDTRTAMLAADLTGAQQAAFIEAVGRFTERLRLQTRGALR